MLQHTFVSQAPDGPDPSKLRPSNWGSVQTDYGIAPTHKLTGGADGALIVADDAQPEGGRWLAPGAAGQVLTVVGGLPAWQAPSLAFSALTGKPTTLAGYGISDAYSRSEAEAAFAPAAHQHPWGDITGAPTTAAGFGLTDVYLKDAADARFAAAVHTHPWSQLTAVPTTLAGFGITDGITGAEAVAAFAPAGHSHAFGALTAKPTTLAGYGITDAFSQAAADSLYAPLVHSQAWSTITGTPTTRAGYGITDAAAAVHTHAWGDITSGVPAAVASLVAGTVLAGDGTQTAPGMTFTAATGTGFYRVSGSVLGVAVGGNDMMLWTTSAPSVVLRGSAYLAWGSANTATPDNGIYRDGAGAFGFRFGTQSHQLRVYGTYTDGTNYERLEVTPTSIAQRSAGAGTARSLGFGTIGATSVFFFTNNITRWSIDPNGHLSANSDGVSDIGFVASNRPRNLYLTGNIVAATISGTDLRSLSGAAASSGTVHYRMQTAAGVSRWNLGLSTVETGSGNTGSDWSLWSYDDAGAFMRTALTVRRSDGYATFVGGLTAGAVTATGNLTGAYLNQSGGWPTTATQAATRDYAEKYVQSRGLNLITNGSGLLGSNYNFPGATFYQADVAGGRGSFKYTSFQTVLSSEQVPVDPTKYYKLSFWTKAIVDAAKTFYGGLQFLDIDGNVIAPYHVMRVTGTDTTLAAPLKPGDTTITLASSANWKNSAGDPTYQRQIIVFGYKNSFGYKYPDYTYSRYQTVSGVAAYANGAWAGGGISGNVITLAAPWPASLANPDAGDGAWPVGTAVSNANSGGSYAYIAGNNTAIPTTWTQFSGTIGTIDFTGQNNTTQFRPGTAYINLVWLVNYQGTSAGEQAISNVWFGELTANNIEAASTTVAGIVTTSAQSFSGIKTFASGAVFGLGVTWSAGAGAISHIVGPTDQAFVIRPGASGQLLRLQDGGGTSKISLDTTGVSVLSSLQLTGNMTLSADNTYDLGATAANRFRNAYFSNSVQIGGSLIGNNTGSRLICPANGQWNMLNNASTAGIGLDFATDAVLKLRTRAQTAYATLDVLGLRASGTNGANFSGTPTSITVVNGIVTAAA